MTDNIENLVLEHLKALRNELRDLRTETHNNFDQVNIQLAAMGQQMAGLTSAVYASNSRCNTLEERVKRIERRLELQD